MPGIDAKELQHAEIALALSGTFGSIAVATFKKFDWKDGAAKEAVRDSQGKVIGYVIKQQETSLSISMLTSEWLRIRARLVEAYPDKGPGQVALDITATYGRTLVNKSTARLLGVMFNEEAITSSDNQDALVIDIPCFVLEIHPPGGPFIKYATA